jgi:hypothetical protein
MNINSLTSPLPGFDAYAASSVQQQADTPGVSPANNFLAQLQQVQSPQQFQAMISQLSGQPDQPAGSGGGTPPTAKHCQGGGQHRSSPPQSSPLNGSQNQSLIANKFGSINPTQSAVL